MNTQISHFKVCDLGITPRLLTLVRQAFGGNIQ